MNGKFVKWEDANVHITTHTLHYGSGVFDGLRAYETPRGPAIFRLADHMKRLENSAQIHKIKMPFSGKEIGAAIIRLVKLNKLTGCYIRPLVYYGVAELKMSPYKHPVDTAIIAFPLGTYISEEAKEKGIRCKISSWVRIHSTILPPKAKCCGNYANSILAHKEARDDGFDDGIMLDLQGNAVEGPTQNLFIVRNSTLITPPPESDILLGLTRDSLITIAKDLGIKVVERNIPHDEIYLADEAFITGTASELTPITSVDNRTIGEGKRGPITTKLQKVFFDAVRGKVPKYRDWLTVVK